MKSINWFNFYPVGHGLFYCGIIPNCNFKFVYDCGGSYKNRVNGFINHFAKYVKDNCIDFLAISHLHKDHVSGVKRLLNTFKIKDIYLPYLCEDDEIRLALAASIMIINEVDIDDIYSILNLYEERLNREYKKSDYHICYDIIINDYWKFKFFTKTISINDEIRFKTDYDNLCQKYGTNDIKTIIQNHMSELKKIYENTFGKGNKLNETSLILLHYPVCYENLFLCNVYTTPYEFEYVSPSTLLTGDAMFDNNISTEIYKEIKSDLGIIQVPHHGSYNNWHALDINLKRNNSIYIIPDGGKLNITKTLQEIKNRGYRYEIVNHYSGFPYWIIIK